MKGGYIRSTIRAEIKRVGKVGGPIDREHLNRETGLHWPQLEATIADVALEMAAEFSARGLPPGTARERGAGERPRAVNRSPASLRKRKDD